MEEVYRPLAAPRFVLHRARTRFPACSPAVRLRFLTLCTPGYSWAMLRGSWTPSSRRRRSVISPHHNFPSFSVGETRPSRGPGRREIGHGALAERALLPVIPPVSEFPYALRLVSEVISSNGSTSQGSVCGSTLALMDAGVPIKAPVAGISCGLITDGGQETTFTPIFRALRTSTDDMGFKVAGTRRASPLFRSISRLTV